MVLISQTPYWKLVFLNKSVESHSFRVHCSSATKCHSLQNWASVNQNILEMFCKCYLFVCFIIPWGSLYFNTAFYWKPQSGVIKLNKSHCWLNPDSLYTSITCYSNSERILAVITQTIVFIKVQFALYYYLGTRWLPGNGVPDIILNKSWALLGFLLD